MPTTKSWEGKYTGRPQGWTKRDLRMLDRLIKAFADDNPLNREAVPVDLHTDLHNACQASTRALRELKQHLAENGRRL